MKPARVVVCRGGIVESKHVVYLTAVTGQGEVLMSLGSKDYLTYWRSAAKPFQVIPLLEAGGEEKFGFTGEELAVMVSSHSGEKEHLRVLGNILKKIKLEEQDLDCGISPPIDKKEAGRILTEGQNYRAIHNPCSGKHLAILALGKLLGISIVDYRLLEHPVQKLILEAVSRCAGIDWEQIVIGTDGCGVPVYGMPLANMALAYARLSQPYLSGEGQFGKSLDTVFTAMTKNPFFVAGTKRLETILMEVTGGKLVAKSGAEGVFCVGAPDKDIGIMLKVADGSSRAIGPVIIHTLNKLGLLTSTEYDRLSPQANPLVKNHQGDVVGEILVNGFRKQNGKWNR